VVTGARSEWWVRSFADGDTHIGSWSPATRSVHSACGLEFQPLAVGWPAQLAPLPGSPPDSTQICGDCVVGIRVQKP
jgi:hypothetical protein